MELGRVGVWNRMDGLSAAESAEFAQRIEALGYSALWIPDAFGRDPFAHASWIFSHTQKLIVATGVVNIHLREALATACAQRELHDQSGGRFLLGLGVSHSTVIEGMFGRAYPKPVPSMRAYLEAMEKAPWWGPEIKGTPPIVLGSLGPLMLKLAGERTQGAHPFFAPPSNTRRTREIVGPQAWVCPEQKLVLESDPGRARKRARLAMAGPLGMPNYRNNLMRAGFESAELDEGGNDRVVDAVVAWGDLDALERRVQEHFEAGASHVCIQALNLDGSLRPDMKLLEALAPRLCK